MGDSHANQFVTRNLCNILSLIGNGTRFRRDQAGNGLQSRCLSCTVCSDQGDDLSLVYLKLDSLDCLDHTIVDFQVFYLKYCHRSNLLLSKISRDDALIVQYFRCLALGQYLAEI